ncbi:hypothetical protein RB195_005727 [Necator americanus]|uniref:Reverse transcriptase domain-containing protein n=1 Tax=Necator americanus TaxID=51031 RepID=A0ABR1BT63_NECAM
MTSKTIHGNSQFQKLSSLRWTWESPGGGYRNEIDHTIVNKRFCLTDVAVVPKFYTRLDHRLLRGRFPFTRREEKAVKFRERNPRTIINWDLFATLAGFWEDSSTRAHLDSINEEYDREAIKEDLKERRAELLAEAAEAIKNIRYASRDFAFRKTRMTALRTPKRTTPCPLGSSPSEGRRICHSRSSPVQNTTCYLVDKKLHGTSSPPRNFPPGLINTLASLFTRYLSECKVPKQWKTSKIVLSYKKGDPHDIGNYRSICLLPVIYKLFTRVVLNRIEKVLDEAQPCEQTGFRKGFSAIGHIHTVSKIIEVSREYKMPLCLTFIDLKKPFDSVETEAVVEALDNQDVPTQYIKVLRELYSKITTGISPFYKNIIIDVKRGVRQGDTISPKIFTATLENAMRNISQAERMLTEFDETCGCIGLQLNLKKTMFMVNGWVSDAPFTLSGKNISECTSYI